MLAQKCLPNRQRNDHVHEFLRKFAPNLLEIKAIYLLKI